MSDGMTEAFRNLNEDRPKSGGKGSFTIWLGGRCIDGHMWLPDSTTDDELGYKIIKYVTKVCEENGLSISETYKQITHNLEMNNIKL